LQQTGQGRRREQQGGGGCNGCSRLERDARQLLREGAR
jgi:hypothetical protein